jgi:hypothetical protein
MCLIKFHTMKTYPCAELALCHEDVWETGDIAHRALSSVLDGREWLASPSHHFTSDLDVVTKRKIPTLTPRPVHSLFTTLEYPSSRTKWAEEGITREFSLYVFFRYC